MAAIDVVNHSNSTMSSAVDTKPESGHHEGMISDIKPGYSTEDRVLVTSEDVSPTLLCSLARLEAR